MLGDLGAGSLEALERVAFVAQDAPLHKYLSVRSMVAVARNLNSPFTKLKPKSGCADWRSRRTARSASCPVASRPSSL